ncbi:uncharacterized protein LOC124927069 [Impatiens glandulifera]|uniref:uncharacterized protein LOC124927069 n=1 Tax=Impatiens glandulifera TaxID=253017 RepID=UPI001FB0580B|nr:uncharacterized protein LOC124927069 [Impatiens glandulifera]
MEISLIEDIIDHFGHEHPLCIEDFENKKERLTCNGCGIVIAGRGYVCSSADCGGGFNIHALCATLPKGPKIFPEHPQHPVRLLSSSPYPNSPGFVCDVCDKSYPSSGFFLYHCDTCGFDVDLRCAVLRMNFSYPGHSRHKLQARLSPASSFPCSACDSTHQEEAIFFRCYSCPFWIHEACFTLPMMPFLTIKSHPHPLTLINRMQRPLPGFRFVCAVCNDSIFYHTSTVTQPRWVYACQKCFFLVHVKCLTKLRESEKNDQIQIQILDQKGLIQLPAPDRESIHLLMSQFIKQMCEEEEEDELQHFSHEHPLYLIRSPESNDGSSEFGICNACVLRIASPPFYGCNDCDFRLHKWCASLPKELNNHQAHPGGHTLTLIGTDKEAKWFGFFQCKGCQRVGNGFAYRCNECDDYMIDVRCASLPESIMHDAHDHPLTLKNNRTIGGCIGCGDRLSITVFCDACNPGEHSSFDSTSMLSYGCDTCFFGLHTRCVFFPEKLMHDYDKHPLTLTRKFIVDMMGNEIGNDDVYFCEICYRPVERWWTYSCEDCNHFYHTGCLSREIGLFTSIKYGDSYRSKHHSQHPVVCVKAINEWSDRCDQCKEKNYCGGFAFECGECKILLDMQCAYLSSKAKRVGLSWNKADKSYEIEISTYEIDEKRGRSKREEGESSVKVSPWLYGFIVPPPPPDIDN